MSTRLDDGGHTAEKLRTLLGDQARLVATLEKIGTRLRSRILHNGEAFEHAFPGFSHRFVEPVKRIAAIRFGTLPSGAAFNLDSIGVMTVNVGHVTSMLVAICDDVDSQSLVARRDVQLADGELGKLMVLAVELFLLHEIRHGSQGLSDYDSVQRLKAAGATMAIGTLDLIADRDAAHAYALLRATKARSISTANYLQYFAEALFFGGMYGFPAFKMSKPHKTARALGITIMLARIVVAERDGTAEVIHRSHLPLDTALMPHIGADWSTLVIFAYTPDLQLVTVEVEIDSNFLSDICGRLDSGDFLPVLEDTITLLRGIGLV